MQIDPTRQMLRHALATVAYRAGKVIVAAPATMATLNAGEGTRSAAEILAHMGDLFDWALTLVQGDDRWHNSPPLGWEEETARFYTSLERFDNHLASDAPLAVPAEQLLQGPVADALTHVGQLALLRRLAGRPVSGENFFKAPIPMPSIFEPAVASKIIERIGRLSPELQPGWGEMTAPKMLSHVTDHIRQGLGELEVAGGDDIRSRYPLNKLFISIVEWPRGRAQSPAGFLQGESQAWASDVEALVALVERAAANGAEGVWAVSPVFGKIEGKDWGVLIYRHLDHHLTQFGV